MTATATRDAQPPAGNDQPVDEFHLLHVDSLTTAGDNVRKHVGDVTELAASIKAQGMIQPIVATMRSDDDGARFVVVAGHRRLAAAKKAGLEKVPVILRTLDDQGRLEAMLAENLEREDLTPLEEAAGYQRLIDECGLTQRQLAERVNRSQGHISKRLTLLDLPEAVQAQVDSGGIEISDALELAKLKDMPRRLQAAIQYGARQGNYAYAVKQQLAEHELAEKIGAATKKLQDDGVTIVKTNSWAEPTRGKELDDWSIRGLKLTPANHKNEPCHAAAVHPRDGRVIYVCTKPANHTTGVKREVPADEKEKARKQREADKRAQLRAREQNIALGLALETKLAAPKIDAENMRLIADLLVMEIGAELAHSSFKFTDDDSQTVIEKKDGTISRIAHVEGSASRRLLDDRLAEAKTAEEIMGVLLQALIATRYVNRDAVPQSQRWPDVRGIYRGAYEPAAKAVRTAIEKIARKHGVVAAAPRTAAAAQARRGRGRRKAT
ncbi:MAG: ParB/RepB/Spo0J family partition protein [Gaiellaceae bacterium]